MKLFVLRMSCGIYGCFAFFYFIVRGVDYRFNHKRKRHMKTVALCQLVIFKEQINGKSTRLIIMLLVLVIASLVKTNSKHVDIVRTQYWLNGNANVSKYSSLTQATLLPHLSAI